ncbi:DUF4835 family protein [Leptobacterium flavescens]|uniref:DUF4835 family protein n=1 Tax=Leptobacterium flavescens TaxID=472055 RepID=A0A6P0UN52_9FLAO|nr:DUF4835 family protein [Leptobacterium flavescens]NER13308.1 DUF4835 family protein [Leptobacterium flavescens]
MLKKILFLFALSFTMLLQSQELNCTIIVNSDQVNQTNQQIFKTLERSLNDYVNKTKWTNKRYGQQERINCNMLITITSFDSNSEFSGTIQVQSSRPVFNASYETPVFNHNDRQFNFNYLEFEPLFYNPNSYESNLVGVITYYVYVILGIDADTFSKNAGTEYFEKAREVVNLAQGAGYLGWQQADGNRTRWELIDNMLSNTFREYRTVMYNYHRLGLDVMVDNGSLGKQSVASCMKIFENLVKRRPNSFLLQTFFDAKSEEILNVFSDGPKVDIVSLKNSLNKIAPFYANTWEKIKY